MPATMIRAYLCPSAACGIMATELGSWVAEKKGTVLLLPSSWLLDPDSAPKGDRLLPRMDKIRLRTEGPITFPILFVESPAPGAETRIVREADWLAFTKGE